MRLRREASLGMGAILGLQILLSMMAIALLTRMGPAIERILEENVYSGEAVEEMLAALASAPADTPGGPPAAFDAALARARANVTEHAERPLLETIESRRAAAFAGDMSARERVITALRQLGQVNRDSMIRADKRAKRLGQAGGWAAALMGALALGLGILVYRRLRTRLELPIEELRRTMQRIRAGNLQARCSLAEGPTEVMQIATDVDWLLDRWLAASARAQSGAGAGPEAEAEDKRGDELRRLLCWLLDERARPTVVLDADGDRVAASKDALAAQPAADWQEQEVPGTGLRVLSRGGRGAPAEPDAALPGDE